MLKTDMIQEAYEIMLQEAKGKEAIMGYIEALDKHYGHPPNVDIDLNDIAKGKHGKGIHYKALQSAAKSLAKSGKIKFDGFNKIIAFVKESSTVNEASHPALIQIADMFTRYLIGDKNVAVNQMKKENQMKTRGLANMDASEYNTLYNKIHTDIFQVMRKHMKDLM